MVESAHATLPDKTFLQDFGGAYRGEGFALRRPYSMTEMMPPRTFDIICFRGSTRTGREPLGAVHLPTGKGRVAFPLYPPLSQLASF